MDYPIINNQNQLKMSYKSILKANILSVDGSKINKRNVKITCHNKEAGKLVISTIQQNVSLFGGYKMEKISDGLGAKDFTVKFEIRDGAQKFYDNIVAILNDKSVVATEPEQSKLEKNIQNVQAKLSNAVSTVTGLVTRGPVGTSTTGVTTTDGAQNSAPIVNNEVFGEDTSNVKPILLAGGALLLVLVIVLLVWKKKK